MEYRYLGIILNKQNVGETDRIHTIYTLEGGKIRSLAKGVRKPHAKLAASLEKITLADVTIIKNRGIGKITGSIVENNFSSLKKDYDALMETFLALNIFDKLVDHENPDPHVFELLKSYLSAVDVCATIQEQSLTQERTVLERDNKYVLLRLGFIIKLLDGLGYSIEVKSCVSCGGLLFENFLRFSSSHGGVLCEKCSMENSNLALPIKANAIKLIRIFLKNKIGTFSKIQASREDCDGVKLVMDDFLQWTL